MNTIKRKQVPENESRCFHYWMSIGMKLPQQVKKIEIVKKRSDFRYPRNALKNTWLDCWRPVTRISETTVSTVEWVAHFSDTGTRGYALKNVVLLRRKRSLTSSLLPSSLPAGKVGGLLFSVLLGDLDADRVGAAVRDAAVQVLDGCLRLFALVEPVNEAGRQPMAHYQLSWSRLATFQWPLKPGRFACSIQLN